MVVGKEWWPVPESENKRQRVDSYRDLLVWQKAMDLVEIVYRLAKKLPSTELYGLASQMQRAAVSVVANIAEGHGRYHLGEKLHSFPIANGSLKEVETHLLVAVRLAFMDEEDVKSALSKSDEIGRMLLALVRSLRGRKA